MKQTLFILLLILSGGCDTSFEKGQTNRNKEKGLNEKFVLKSFNVGVEIYLKPDFAFINNCYSYGCTGGFRIKLVTGHYRIDSNQIIFTPEKMLWKEDWENHYWESDLKFDTLAYYESDTTSIQKKYWLIRQGKIKFLVSETGYNQRDELFYKTSNIISLANLYNSNIEQRTSENILSNIDTLWNFRKLEINQGILYSYKDYFLDSAISAEVLSSKVSKIGESLIPKYKLHIKENERVKTGMKFYSREFPNHPIVIIGKDGEDFIASGPDLFYENTKLKNGTSVSTERRKVSDN